MRFGTWQLMSLIAAISCPAVRPLQAQPVRDTMLVSAVVRAPSCVASASNRDLLAVSCSGSTPLMARVSTGPGEHPSERTASAPPLLTLSGGAEASAPWTIATLPESQGVVVVRVTY